MQATAGATGAVFDIIRFSVLPRAQRACHATHLTELRYENINSSRNVTITQKGKKRILEVFRSP